jgi:hypothetical protein
VITRTVQTPKLLIMQFAAVSGYPVALRSQYLCQHPNEKSLYIKPTFLSV